MSFINIFSLLLSFVSVVIGIISIMLTLSVKEAVARTENQILNRNLKLQLSLRMVNISSECTNDNILQLHELLSELYKNHRLPHDKNIEGAEYALENYIRENHKIYGVQKSGEIVSEYQKARAAAISFINNLDVENP